MIVRRKRGSDVGEMNKRIVFAESQRIPDGAGGGTSVNSPLFETWARIESVNNQWIVQQGMQQTDDLRQFVVRYRTEINKTMKIIYDGRTFDMLSMDSYGTEKNYLKILASGKVINNG